MVSRLPSLFGLHRILAMGLRIATGPGHLAMENFWACRLVVCSRPIWCEVS